ncbi:ATP-binding cassette domain-containing protein [Ningiella sp. W23]|uniref:ATP-binding cassette domain-containing protein n=1 Tax=Ningiella sp. W23 TaxID=3023715 RepID=UPI003756B0C9
MLKLSSVSVEGRISDIALDIEAGQWWTLLGPNGAGKSSLLSVCAGLEQYDGNIAITPRLTLQTQAHSDKPNSDKTNSDKTHSDKTNSDKTHSDKTHRNKHCAALRDLPLSQLSAFRCMLTQQHQLQFHLSVSELFSFFTALDNIPAPIDDALSITELIDQAFHQLSGGEQQRVHLARNLMQVWPAIETGSALLILDEPLQQMDVRIQIKSLTLFQSLASLGNTIIMSDHDINHALHFSTHCLLLKGGRQLKHGPSQEVLSLENLERLYQHKFEWIERADSHTVRKYCVARAD